MLGVSAIGCLQPRDDTTQTPDVARCATCHGDPARAGDYLSRAAPPTDLSGGTDPSYPGVGAHSVHLSSSSTHAAFACSECHVVPERTDLPGHADHGSPATLVFGSLAKSDGHAPRYDLATRTCQDSYCHGKSDAVWNAPRSFVAGFAALATACRRLCRTHNRRAARCVTARSWTTRCASSHPSCTSTALSTS